MGDRTYDESGLETERSIKLRNQREREAARKTRSRLADNFDIAVVGISFQPAYPGNMFELERINFIAEQRGERVPVVFLREPDNPHDANCVAIHCPALGETMGLLGKIPRGVAARLAPELDDGQHWQGEVAFIRIDNQHLNNPGLTVHATRRKDP